MALFDFLGCDRLGHVFISDGAPDERCQRTCRRCGLVRGAPEQPVSERAVGRALEKLAAAARHEARGARAGGNERFKHRVLAEAEREVSRRIMQDEASDGSNL